MWVRGRAAQSTPAARPRAGAADAATFRPLVAGRRALAGGAPAAIEKKPWPRALERLQLCSHGISAAMPKRQARETPSRGHPASFLPFLPFLPSIVLFLHHPWAGIKTVAATVGLQPRLGLGRRRVHAGGRPAAPCHAARSASSSAATALTPPGDDLLARSGAPTWRRWPPRDNGGTWNYVTHRSPRCWTGACGTAWPRSRSRRQQREVTHLLAGRDAPR